MNKATHTTADGHLYRIVTRCRCDPLDTSVELWDKYTNQWRSSIMGKSELIKIQGAIKC